MNSPLVCTNCGTTQDVRPSSIDPDLPTVALCLICWHLSGDQEAFAQMGKLKLRQQ